MSKKQREVLEAKLSQLQQPEWDSDEGESTEQKVVSKPAAKAPRKPTAAAEARRRVTTPGAPSAVVYVGHIPHGFYEDAMKGFFNQFGEVQQLRLSRSKKTGRSKGYAFIEFSSPAVAAVVAETMDKYFLEHKQLVCHVVPQDAVHERTFVGSNRKFQPVNWHEVNKKKVNANRTQEEHERHVQAVKSRDGKKRKRLEALGIDYQMPEVGVFVRAPRVKKAGGASAEIAAAGSAETAEGTAPAAAKGKKAKEARAPPGKKGEAEVEAAAAAPPAAAAAAPAAAAAAAPPAAPPAAPAEAAAAAAETPIEAAKQGKTPAKAAKTPRTAKRARKESNDALAPEEAKEVVEVGAAEGERAVEEEAAPPPPAKKAKAAATPRRAAAAKPAASTRVTRSSKK